MLGAVFELIGIATVVTVASMIIKIVWDDCIKPLKCNHNYKIVGSLQTLDSTILFLTCEKCGKQKDIEIYERIEITKRGE